MRFYNIPANAQGIQNSTANVGLIPNYPFNSPNQDVFLTGDTGFSWNSIESHISLSPFLSPSPLSPILLNLPLPSSFPLPHRYNAKPQQSNHKRENLEIALEFVTKVENIKLENIGKYHNSIVCLLLHSPLFLYHYRCK